MFTLGYLRGTATPTSQIRAETLIMVFSYHDYPDVTIIR